MGFRARVSLFSEGAAKCVPLQTELVLVPLSAALHPNESQVATAVSEV